MCVCVFFFFHALWPGIFVDGAAVPLPPPACIFWKVVVVEASSFFGEGAAGKEAGIVAAVADTAIVEVFDLHVKVCSVSYTHLTLPTKA